MTDRGSTAASARRTYGLLAEFETPAAIFSAAERVRDAGYRWWDCHTPFPVHGLDRAMGIRPTILPWLVMACGLGGATFGFLLQWFTNATSFDMWALVWVRGYDFLISGKPLLSGAVYPIVMFELTVLFAALGCVALLMLLNGLPWLYHPCFKSERFGRATDDRFFIVIETRDPLYYRARTEAFLRSLGPAAVEELET
ncbi:MAG: DUF3341 domain-containing protein [Planctomycetota bacterium]|jgi:hypothetical protein